MSNARTGRRFLIATAACRYAKESSWNVPELQDDLDRIIGLFTTTFGYQRVTPLGLNPAKDELKDELRAFCKDPDRRPDDYLVVYFAGHGEVLDTSQDYILLPSDTDPEDLAYTGLRTGDLIQTLLEGTSVRRLLLLLDTCFAGDGGMQAAVEALGLERQRRDRVAEPGFVVVTATRPAQLAAVGAFTTELTRAVASLATGGYALDALDIGAVVRVMNDSTSAPKTQQVTWMPVGLTGQLPAFLPNPRRDQALSNVDLLVQVRAEEAARRDVDERRFLVRAKASNGHDDSWWFAGRQAALSRIATWLDTAAPEQPALVVTGGPGSGKTAVLGLVSTLANPDRRPTVPIHQLGLPPTAVPKPASIDASIYAGNLTSKEVLRGLAAAAGVQAVTAGVLISKLSGRQRPLTLLVDALDEAANPDELISEVLQPLIDERGQAPLRLLLGTRPHLIPLLGARIEKLDLDDEAYADPESLGAYAHRGLLEATPESPYRTAPEHTVQAVAHAVAEAAGYSFLIARITSRTLGEADRIPNPDDAAWRAGLPRLPGPAIRADLDQRLGADASRAMDLLLPLAYAEGQGLPWENIWPALASRISGHAYTQQDLLWLRHRVGSYIIEASEEGYSAYRLYHQALAEYVRANSDPLTVQSAFADILTSTAAPMAAARPDWTRAHPYARSYLSTHAAAAGRLDELLLDPGFLLTAGRGRLLEALPAAQSPPAVRAAAAYRHALNRMTSGSPGDRPAYLRLAALCDGATELVAAITETTPAPWRAKWAAWDPTDPNEVLTGHLGWTSAVAVTMADGRPVAVTACQGYDELRLSDLHTFTSIGGPIPTGHQSWIGTVAVTRLQGRPVIVTIGRDVRLTDMDTRMPVGEPFCTGGIGAKAVAELDGRPVVIVGASEGNTVQLWDLADRSPVADPIRTGHTFGIGAVALAQVEGHPAVVTCGKRDWRHDGVDDTVRLWDPSTGAAVGDPIRTGLDSGITTVAVTEVDGRSTAIVGAFDKLRLVDLSARVPIGEPFRTGHPGGIGAIAVTVVDGRPTAITTGHDDSRVRLWDLRSGDATGDAIWTGPFIVRSIAVTQIAGRPTAIVGAADGSVRVVDLLDPPAVDRQRAARIGAIGEAAVVQLDGRPAIVTTSRNSTAVRLWEVGTGEPAGDPIRTSHEGGIAAMAVAQLDGHPTVITGGRGRYRGSTGDSTLQLLDLHTRTQVGDPIQVGDSGGIGAVAVTEVGGKPTIVTGNGYTYAATGAIQLWDLHTRARVRRPIRTEHGAGQDPVTVTHLDGHPVVVTGQKHTAIQLWDLDTGTAVGRPLAIPWFTLGGALAVTQVDGHDSVLAAGDDGMVRLWELGPIRFPRSRLLPASRATWRSLGDNSVVSMVSTIIFFLLVGVVFLLEIAGKLSFAKVLHGGDFGWISAVVLTCLVLGGILQLTQLGSGRQKAVEPTAVHSTNARVTALCCRPDPRRQYVYVGSGNTVELLRVQRQHDGRTSADCLVPLEISVDVGASITSLVAVEPTSLLVGTIKGMVLLDFPDLTKPSDS